MARDDHPPDLDHAAIDHARETIERGDVVRIVAGRKVFLCTTIEDARAAVAGRCAQGAVRLDGAARR